MVDCIDPEEMRLLLLLLPMMDGWCVDGGRNGEGKSELGGLITVRDSTRRKGSLEEFKAFEHFPRTDHLFILSFASLLRKFQKV